MELSKEVNHSVKCMISNFKKECPKDSLDRIYEIRRKVLKSIKDELKPHVASKTATVKKYRVKQYQLKSLNKPNDTTSRSRRREKLLHLIRQKLLGSGQIFGEK